jgi:hypothetical protein
VECVKHALAKRLLNLDEYEVSRHLVVREFIEGARFPYDERK